MGRFYLIFLIIPVKKTQFITGISLSDDHKEALGGGGWGHNSGHIHQTPGGWF